MFPALLHDGEHSQNSVDGRAQVMGHMGKELAFCRVGPPYPFQQLQNGLLLLFPRHGDFRDVLMVSAQAGS